MDEDWMTISDIAHRRRVQNRLAQRKHRVDPNAVSRADEARCATRVQNGQAFRTETFDSFAVDDLSPMAQPNMTGGLNDGPEHGDGRNHGLSSSAGGVPDCWFDGGQFMPNCSAPVHNNSAMTTMVAPDEFAVPTDPLVQGVNVGYGGYYAIDGSSRGGHEAQSMWPTTAQFNGNEWQQPPLVSPGDGKMGQLARPQQPQPPARNRVPVSPSPQHTSNLRGMDNRSDNNDADPLLHQAERPSQSCCSAPRRSNSGRASAPMYPPSQRRQSAPSRRPAEPSASGLLREHGIDLNQILASSARYATRTTTPPPAKRRSPPAHADRQAEVDIVVPEYQQQGMNMESSRGQYAQGGYEESYEQIAGSRVSKVVVIYLEE
ncbi:hypothetical protein DHEL01_v205588 [Diaporthe helianthi]|uniref:BZIP domain-containing protein n=1 Tax=Diaporthe helianthi TaxID=158607 RepID=A0A2P5I0K4_DIAHE|nr:hypothetical protein DHEL01_v205588 [Diaporthe helianthi]